MITFNSLLIIGAVAVAVPLLLGLVPAVKVPAVVLEILGGVLVGPEVLGWVHLDAAVQVTADLGLGFLLFMAGYEIDLRRFERRVLILAGQAFVVSVALALLVAYGLQLVGQVKDGPLVGITLVATSLGVLVPILKDAGQTKTGFGHLIMAAGSLAELAPPRPAVRVFFGVVGEPVGGAGAARRVRRLYRGSCGGGPSRQEMGPVARDSAPVGKHELPAAGSAGHHLRPGLRVVAEHFGLAMILGAFLAGSSCAGPASRRPPMRNSKASWKRSGSGS
jgi:Sodium/hydrogen exchanger family